MEMIRHQTETATRLHASTEIVLLMVLMFLYKKYEPISSFPSLFNY